MKFIHCADVHLDSRLSANLSAAKSKQRRTEILNTFCNLVKYAAQESVDAVIIAGDLFDSDRLSPVTRDMVLSEIQAAKNVDFLYLSGNHDSGKTLTDCELPENLHLFSDEWSSFDYGNVCITGVELNENNFTSIYSSLILDKDRLNIVVMHGEASSSSNVNSVNISKLANRNIDYLALGHYHEYSKGKIDNRGEWCQAGCLEGRGFDECGDKGFVLIETDGKEYESRFVKFSKRDILCIKCDVSGIADIGDMLAKIVSSVENISNEAMVRVELFGDLPEGARKDMTLFGERLSDMFYSAKIVDKTRLLICPEDFIGDVSLKGEFIRLVFSAELDDETKSLVSEIGLAALAGREVL